MKVGNPPKSVGDPTRRDIWLIVGLVIGFFFAVHGLLPRDEVIVRGLGTRFVVSVLIFTSGILAVMFYPRIAVPFAIGIYPILYLLMVCGAVYGRGITLFYLIIILLTIKIMPRTDMRGKVTLRGGAFLFLLCIQCFSQILLQYFFTGEAEFFIAVNFISYFLLVYFVSNRLSGEMFALTLYALAASCFAAIFWALQNTALSILFQTRLGIDIGMNPNMIGQFCVQLAYAVFLLGMLRKSKSVNVSDISILAFCGFMIFLSGSRSAIAQFGILIVPALLKYKHKMSWKTTLACLGAFIAIFLVFAKDIGHLIADMSESQQYLKYIDTSIKERDPLNHLSWELAAAHPLFGVGPGNYTGHSLLKGLSNEEGLGQPPHNAIAGTAAEFGYIGLTLFLLWYITFLTSHAPGKPYGIYIIVFSLMALVQGASHGLFLDAPGAFPFLFAILIERELSRARRLSGSVRFTLKAATQPR